MVDATPDAKGRISDGTAVRIGGAPFGTVWQIAAGGRLDPSVALPCGLSMPGDFRTSHRAQGVTLWRIAPDRVLIASDAPMEAPEAPGCGVLDLSHARVRLRLDGPGAAGLLARLMPVDTALAAFPADSFAQTAIHHVAVLIDRRAEETFDVLVPSTWVRAVAGAMRRHLVA